MLALFICTFAVLCFFLLLQARRPPGACVKGCHGCGKCNGRKQDSKEE